MRRTSDLDRYVVVTYRYLRLMVLALAGLLLLRVGLQIWVGEAPRGSLSDYYDSPVRDLFVGCLIGAAALLVVYRGTTRLEEFALSLAGFAAFFVALVPVRLDLQLDSLPDDAARQDLLIGMRLSVLSVLVVAAVLAFLDYRYLSWSPPSLREQPVTRWALVLSVIALVGFIALVLWRAFDLDGEFAQVHGAAAFLLIGGLGLSVAAHVWPERVRTSGDLPVGEVTGRGRRVSYGVLLLLMLAGVVAYAWAAATSQWSWVLWVEVWEVFIFGVFWLAETVRQWHQADDMLAGRIREP